MKNSLLGVMILVFAGVSARADLMKDFDSLGGNDVLLEKAKALNPETKVEVVQDRIVNRRHRFEIAPELGEVLGGDSYDITRNVGANVHYHLTPRWSLGLKYNYSVNKLSPEGNNVINDTKTTGTGWIPQIDYPKQETLAMVDWYPIYGKLNMYDLGVVHFDVYTLLGAGKVELHSGTKSTYTAGAGIGFWISQHFTTRFEMRYQTYKASYFDGDHDLNLTIASVQAGYLF